MPLLTNRDVRFARDFRELGDFLFDPFAEFRRRIEHNLRPRGRIPVRSRMISIPKCAMLAGPNDEYDIPV